MKRSNQILSIAFLLLLLISSIFAVSATEYSVSEQSITSFDETLPDDVLFYPDGDFNQTVFASAGSALPTETGTYAKTDALDADYYRAAAPDTPYDAYLELNFTVPSFNLGDTVYLNTYGKIDFQYPAAYTDNSLYIWDEDVSSFDDVGNFIVDNTLGWINVTIDSGYVVDGKIFFYYVLEDTDGNSYIYIDYAEVIVTSPIVLSEDSYAESFSDVSDWKVHTGNTITTDGDIGTFTTEGDDVYNIYYCNTPSQSFENYYLEFRYSVNDTDADKLGISLKSEDSYLGDIIYSLGFFHSTTDYETHKVFINESGVVESIAIIIKDDDGDAPIAFNFDYFRISPANESGWQYDGSTTEGTGNGGGTVWSYSDASDGDILTVTTEKIDGSTNSWSEYNIFVDNTITQADIENSYYPMLKVNWRCTSLTAENIYLTLYFDDYKLDGTIYTETFGWTTEYFNIASMDDAYAVEDGLRITTKGDTTGELSIFELNFTKAYSIANYTVTQSGTSIDDVLYVDSGTLYCEGTSFTSITLDYDPTLSFETERSMWTMTTSSGTPEIDFYFDAWLGYTSNTEGDFPDGTLTDFRIKFTDSANVEAITFLSPIPQWNNVGEAELIFSVPIDESGLNMMLIFLGLAMIPASVLYLAKGGKSEMSSNKFYYGLIAFVMGWALFLGGIM